MRKLIAAPLCLYCALLQATVPNLARDTAANDALLHSAHMWEAHDRGDLALLALQKLVAARPDSPEILQELGELALRMNDIDIASNALTQLQARFNNSSATRTFDLEYRLATRDRLSLASLQRLLETNKYAAARAEFFRLFPHGAPNGYLSIRYYQLLASLPGNWQRVRDALTTLSNQHPDEPRYRFALAKHLLRNDSSKLQGVYLLQELSTRDDLRLTEVDDALIVALESLGATQAPAGIVNGYVQRHPEDGEARRLAIQINARQLEERHWWRTVLTWLTPQTSAPDDAAVQSELTRLRQQDPQLDTALGTLFTLDHIDNVTGKALNQAIDDWRTRGRHALEQGHYAQADLNLRIALAFKQGEFENSIALAEQLQAADRDADSGALLDTATQLAPTSSWLFETYIRWLIQHGQSNQALALLANKPLDKEYVASTRDSLLATALQQRATGSSSTAPQQALADLQSALILAPDDVWLRYQLAKRYAQAGNADRGRVLLNEGAQRKPQDPEMRYAQALYLSGIDDSAGALAALAAIPDNKRTTAMNSLQAQLRRTMQRRAIDALVEQQRYAEAAQLLDGLIKTQPTDRGLRVWRAELDQQMQHPQAARDQLALLVAEQPDDLDTRLDYVRALTNSGDLGMARLQLQAVQQRAAPGDFKLQLAIARRAWSLDDARTTAQTLRPVLAQLPDSAEAWLLAGRSELALRNFATARANLLHVEQLPDADAASQARALRLDIEARLQATFTSGVQSRHKPGDAGISQFDSLALLNAWQLPINYEQRLTLRADAVTLDAGRLPQTGNPTTPFGTTYINNRYDHANDRQRGLSIGIIHSTDVTTADIGVTPLGFLLPNVVGGLAWSPVINKVDVTVGVERRAVTSSVLSYAGMRDPATGEKWGGVVATSVYVQAGRYQEQYSLSGTVRAAQFTGTQVVSNRLMSARIAGDWRWLTASHDQSWLGLTVNYWNYQHNLQNYTFGSGGYYSPHSYVSVALPVELQGQRTQWSYQLRVVAAYSASQTQRAAFFPTDAALQAQALTQAQLRGDAEPYFQADSGSGVSFSASARVEYQLMQALVLGGQLAADRSDYYHPVELSVYLRHLFGSRAELAAPPKPLRPYNE